MPEQVPSDSLSIEHERGCAKCGSSTMYVDCWNCGEDFKRTGVNQ